MRPWTARKAIEIWTGVRPKVLRLLAVTVFRTNRLRIKLGAQASQHRRALALAIVVALLALQVWAVVLAHRLDSYFTHKEALDGLRALCLGIGAALIGATAIASSFILFTLQVNVERMPAGLFRRLSADTRLLTAFGVAFLMSALIAFLSLTPSTTWGSMVALATAEACVLTPFIYLYAYRRALRLISPTEQLRMVVARAGKDLRIWGRRADLAEHLFREPEPPRTPMEGKRANSKRLAFFRANANWDAAVRQAIGHVTLYARFYSERGDHEVSFEALRSLVAINGVYIRTKGATFFGNNLMFENPLVTDGIINETLETLRQTMKISLTRGDERQATQTLQTLEFLVKLYLTIEYPGLSPSMTHAVLAASYLSGAVESVIPYKMADVLMDGMRCHGRAAVAFIGAGSADNAAGLVDKLGMIGAVATASDALKPVTLMAMDQLTDITMALLSVRTGRLSNAFGHVSDSVKLIAEMTLQTPDTPFVSSHSSNLAPYFSYQTANLQSRLIQLVNALGEDSVAPETVKQVAENLAEWSDDPQKQFKSLMLLSIEKRSGFTFDIIHFTAYLIEILLAASNLQGIHDRTKKKLQEHALHLTWMLSWVPTDREAALHVENTKFNSILFEIAWKARSRGCDEVYEAGRDILLRWAVRAGAHATGWGILDRSITGLAALAIGDAANEIWLVRKLGEAIASPEAPPADVRSRAARELRETADEVLDATYSLDSVEIVLAQQDYGKKRTYLRQLADIVSPGTAEGTDEPDFDPLDMGD